LGILYQQETALSVAEFAALLADAEPDLHRPVNDEPRLMAMLANADLIVTARDAEHRLVGIARCLTDFVWTCYCAELAVHSSCRGQGIGTAMILYCRQILGPQVSFNLTSVPAAAAFYDRIGPRIGMHRIVDAFCITRERGV
jgi:GNAT superfamily N-acetyltransferase